MKKLKVTIAFAAIMLVMNSCVYSLFPIYTEDTLVFLPELVGKWQSDPNNDEDFIEFIPMSEKKRIELGLEEAPPTVVRKSSSIDMVDNTDGDPDTYSYFMKGDGWSIKSDNPITVTIDGEEVSDPQLVKEHYDELFGELKTDAENGLEKTLLEIDSASKAEGSDFGKMMEDLGKGLSQLGEAIKKTEAKFKGTAYVSTDESYKMVVMSDGERMPYMAHVVEIGEDYFLDIYPLPEYSDATFSTNLFPVHTFMKVGVEDGQLKLTQFDLEKLNELFESNLVRLRHEYVDGNVVITAQPTEIQKFLDRYSNDETVFEGEEVYTKSVL